MPIANNGSRAAHEPSKLVFVSERDSLALRELAKFGIVATEPNSLLPQVYKEGYVESIVSKPPTVFSQPLTTTTNPPSPLPIS